jgi:translation initiation factor IF-1
MPINKQGGSGCKKGKNTKEDDGDILMVECNENDGQMFGRVVKVEGDRRFRIFCNDSKERICKLAGRIRRGDRVEKGGIVLISIRALSPVTEVGDIIANVDPRLYGKVKKLSGINPLLFVNLENEDKSAIKARVERLEEEGDAEDEDLFERADDELSKEDRAAELAASKKKEELLRGAKRDIKYMDNGDVDVDDI